MSSFSSLGRQSRFAIPCYETLRLLSADPWQPVAVVAALFIQIEVSSSVLTVVEIWRLRVCGPEDVEVDEELRNEFTQEQRSRRLLADLFPLIYCCAGVTAIVLPGKKLPSEATAA